MEAEEVRNNMIEAADALYNNMGQQDELEQIEESNN